MAGVAQCVCARTFFGDRDHCIYIFTALNGSIANLLEHRLHLAAPQGPPATFVQLANEGDKHGKHACVAREICNAHLQ